MLHNEWIRHAYIWSCQFSSAQETGNLFLTQLIFQLKITTLISWKCILFKFIFNCTFRVKKGPVGKKLKLWSTITFLRSDLFAFFSWFLCFCVDLILERSNWFCFIFVYTQDSLICVFNIQVLNTMSHKKKNDKVQLLAVFLWFVASLEHWTCQYMLYTVY